MADSEVQSTRADDSTSSGAFHPSFTNQNFSQVGELIDPVPIDESWFSSQDFYFDDIINWQ